MPTVPIRLIFCKQIQLLKIVELHNPLSKGKMSKLSAIAERLFEVSITQATERNTKPATNKISLIIKANSLELLQCRHLCSLKRCVGQSCNSWLFKTLPSFAPLNSVMHIA